MSHERDVAAFMRWAQEWEPAKYREVCDKYPTLTIRQLDYVHEWEVSYDDDDR